MLQEGTEAPDFELPAYVDGEQRRVALADHVGENVVVLAFYPADFNPACEHDADLEELDLLTMQKDLSVLAVGPDSVYSHAAFAGEYDLQLPLLADTDCEVAESYDVAMADDLGQQLCQRAVFVVDHRGAIEYAWATEDLSERPAIDEIKDAISETGGDDTALARYRVGYAHYTEARRAFTSAMNAYQDSEWLMAETDFSQAAEEFVEATEHFDSAVRFVDDPEYEEYYERTKEKASALWQAADWLSESASAYASGSGGEAVEYRDDAERPLQTAQAVGDPIDPDEWPPAEEDKLEPIVPESEDGPAAALEVDVDAAASDPPGESERAEGARGGPDEDAVDVDDEELAEIEAELAGESAEAGELEEEPTSMVDAPPESEDG